MKRYLIIILLAVTGMLSAGPNTLENFVEAGLDNSYNVRQKEIMFKNAKLSVRSAAWNLLPSADISASRTNTNGTYASNGSLEFYRSISITEPTIFNFKSAGIDKSIAQLDLLQTRKQLVYSIYSAWLDIAQLQKEITIQMENLAILQRIADQTIIQQALGQKTIFDVRQSEINVINSQLVISELRNRLSGQRADLFNLAKLSDDGTEFIYSDVDSLVMSIDFGESSETPIPLVQLSESVRQAKLDKLQSRLGLLPSLYVSGNYNQHSVNNDILAFSDYRDNYTLAAGFSWSLWSPFTKGSSYARSANSLILSEWQLEEGSATLNLDKANLKREWDYLTESLTLNARKATQAKDNLRIAQEKYNLGTLSLIELERARVDALEAELAVNKITYQLKKKSQEWNLLNSLPILEKY